MILSHCDKWYLDDTHRDGHTLQKFYKPFRAHVVRTGKKTTILERGRAPPSLSNQEFANIWDFGLVYDISHCDIWRGS